MVANVLTDPDAFFEQRRPNASFWKPLLIVLLAAVVSIGGQLIIFQSISGVSNSGIGAIIGLVGVIFGFVGTLVAWLAFTGLFYLVSAAFSGEGGFGITLKLIGWGFVPSVINGLINSLATYYALQGTTIPQNPQAIATFSQSIQNDPVLQVVSVIGIAFTLWQGFIWVFALQHARSLTLRQAALTVGIPVALLIAFNIYSVLFSGSFV